jgi:hypothetical protein
MNGPDCTGAFSVAAEVSVSLFVLASFLAESVDVRVSAVLLVAEVVVFVSLAATGVASSLEAATMNTRRVRRRTDNFMSIKSW